MEEPGGYIFLITLTVVEAVCGPPTLLVVAAAAWCWAASCRLLQETKDITDIQDSDNDERHKTYQSLSRIAALCPFAHFDRKAPKMIVFTRAADDRLLVAARHNAYAGALTRLPDELLLRIMTHLDPISMHMLRRASRIFLRLFGSPEFARWQAAPPRGSAFFAYGPWAAQRQHFRTTDEWQTWANLLWKDRWCSQCQATRRGDSTWRTRHNTAYHFQYLRCAGCRAQHPRSFFSPAAQQQTGDAGDATRVCIAHEGHVRLCAHKTVAYKDIQSFMAHARLRAELPWYLGGLRQGSASAPPPTKTFTCRHPSHIPAHHRSHHRTLPASVFPSLAVAFVHSADAEFVVTMAYTAHLDLSVYDQQRVPSSDFRCMIESMYARREPPQYITPPSAPGIFLEMRCVDPTRCGCLRYASHLDGPVDTLADATERTRTRQPCAAHTASRTVYQRTSALDAMTCAMDTCPCPRTTRCLQITYRRTFRLSGGRKTREIDWGTGMLFSRRTNSMIRRAQKADEDRGIVALGWYQALDRDSYNLQGSLLGYCSTWCPNPGCRRYVGYFNEFLLLGQKQNDNGTEFDFVNIATRSNGRTQIVSSLGKFWRQQDWEIPWDNDGRLD